MKIPTPCTHLRISDNGETPKELEVFRCDTDGLLVFSHPDVLRVHAGHHLKSPVYLRDEEAEELAKLHKELTA